MSRQILLSPPVICYGACELKQKQQKNTTVGLIFATMLFSMFLGTYWFSIFYDSTRSDDIDGFIRLKVPYEFLPQPPIGKFDAGNLGIAVNEKSSKPEFGNFVPVPDFLVNPDKVIAPWQGDTQGTNGTGGVSDSIIIVPPPDCDNCPPPPFRVVEIYPAVVKQVNPVYPDIARRAGIEGKVWVHAWIDKEGKLRQAVILKSDSQLFDDAVIAAVNQWTFTPALMNNGPVSVWMSIPFEFKLSK